MKLTFKENTGLIPFHIGTSLKEIENLLGDKYEIKKSLFYSDIVRVIFIEQGLFFDMNANGEVEAIETVNKNQVFFHDEELFSMDNAQIQKMLSGYDKGLELKDGITSKVLGISLYYEDLEKKASSILVFREGYFDKKVDLNPIESNGKETTIDDLFDLLK